MAVVRACADRTTAVRTARVSVWSSEECMRTINLVAGVVLIAAPAAGQDPGRDPGRRGVLAALVAELEASHPELEAAARDIEARASRVAPAGAPPDPVLSVGYMSGFLRPPFFPSDATPNAFRQVAVTQELPYPGTLGLRARVAATDVEAARWTAEQTRLRLVADLKQAYVDYVRLTRTIAIVDRHKRALEQDRGVAEARFSVGKATQADVLRAQLEISILLERLALLERDRVMRLADVNRLVHRAPETPVAVADPEAAAPAEVTAAVVRARAAGQSAAVRRDATIVARSEQALTLARREQRPDFGLRLATQKPTGGMPWMYGLELMVNVPLFWGRKQQPMIAEAAAVLERDRSAYAHTVTEAEARAAQEHAALTASRTLIELYDDSVLPQARLTLESSVAAYEVGRVEFLTLITNFIAVLNYEVSLEEQRARARQALARLELLTGMTLLR